jgi:hypothetical protein
MLLLCAISIARSETILIRSALARSSVTTAAALGTSRMLAAVGWRDQVATLFRRYERNFRTRILHLDDPYLHVGERSSVCMTGRRCPSDHVRRNACNQAHTRSVKQDFLLPGGIGVSRGPTPRARSRLCLESLGAAETPAILIFHP